MAPNQKLYALRTLVTLIFLHFVSILFAQEAPNAKFGKVSPADLEKKVYTIDSSANAVVLLDMGSSEIVGNDKGWFSFLYTRHRRVHILNKSGYSYGDVEIPLYKDEDGEVKINSLKAVTYNLENGKVVKTKLEKSAIEIIPAGRILFLPAFVVRASRNEQVKVAQDTRLNASTRKHLLAQLKNLETAFES